MLHAQEAVLLAHHFEPVAAVESLRGIVLEHHQSYSGQALAAGQQCDLFEHPLTHALTPMRRQQMQLANEQGLGISGKADVAQRYRIAADHSVIAPVPGLVEAGVEPEQVVPSVVRQHRLPSEVPGEPQIGIVSRP